MIGPEHACPGEGHCPVCYDEVQRRLERRLKELHKAQANNHQRNLDLDALHYVWCDGGCEMGVGRYGGRKPTAEVVLAAVRNTRRLVRWYEHHIGRLEDEAKLPMRTWKRRLMDERRQQETPGIAACMRLNAKLRAERDRLHDALKLHHEWQLSQSETLTVTNADGSYDLNIAEAYAESELCERTIAALAATLEPPADPAREVALKVYEVCCEYSHSGPATLRALRAAYPQYFEEAERG